MIARDHGLVLRTFALRETSKIICVLSHEYGKLRLVARGVRAPRSRAGASLEVGNEIDFVFSQKPGQELGYLRENALVQPWLARLSRLEILGLGWAALELLERVLPEGGPEGGHLEPEGVILSDLCAYLLALQRMPDRAPALLLFYSFELRLLSRLGLEPDLSGCRVCGSTAGTAFWFDVEAGNGACPGCRLHVQAGVELSALTVAMLRQLIREPWRTEDLVTEPATRRLLGLLLHRLLSRHLERYRYPRSLQLLRRSEPDGTLSREVASNGYQDLEVLKDPSGERA